MKKRTIRDLELKAKRCFVRVDYNVPFDDGGSITDDSRIRSTLPTLNALIDEGAKVILASHIGRPKGEKNPKFSTSLVQKRLSRLLKKDVEFVEDCIGEKVKEKVSAMEEGDVLLLENLRFYKEETENNEAFCKELASFSDVFVNDAFATAHRAHASTCGIAQFVEESVAGLLMKKEIDFFNLSVSSPARPFVAILGGAKASGKIGVLRNLCEKIDKVIVSGGLAFTFMKAMGINVGKSLVEDSLIDDCKEIMKKMKQHDVKYYFPVDFVVSRELSQESSYRVVPTYEIPDDEMALDIGPASAKLFEEVLDNARTIIWNGPMGAFEIDAFSRGTYQVLNAVTKAYATTVVGGGDTDYAIHKAGAEDKISYISTGGGAFLELLEGKELPGIEVLQEKTA